MPNLRERTISVLGSTSVGKSALTLMFINREFVENYDPTIAKSYMKRLNVPHSVDYELTVNDTAGLEEQSQIQTKYLNSDGFILVYSIADMQSFQIVQNIYAKLSDELNGAVKPVVLVGNKSDLKEQRRVSHENGKRLADSWNAVFLETSAKDRNIVERVFETLLKEIDPPSNPPAINNSSSNSTNNQSSNNSGLNRTAQNQQHHHQQQQQQQNQKCIIS